MVRNVEAVQLQIGVCKEGRMVAEDRLGSHLGRNITKQQQKHDYEPSPVFAMDAVNQSWKILLIAENPQRFGNSSMRLQSSNLGHAKQPQQT